MSFRMSLSDKSGNPDEQYKTPRAPAQRWYRSQVMLVLISLLRDRNLVGRHVGIDVICEYII